MTKDLNLAQLQTYFANQLVPKKPASLAELDPLSDLLVDSHFTPTQVFNIYRNNFLISLSDMLEQIFPITQVLVGYDYFTHISRDFVYSVPLKQPHLNDYGSIFVNFLRQLKALEKMQFVGQMAELEWHLDYISHIYYKPDFDFKSLAKISEEHLLNIQFRLSDTCHLQTSKLDLIALHKDLSRAQKLSKSTTITAVTYQQQSYILGLQNHLGEAALMPLDQRHWTWLIGLQNGLTLAQLCDLENTDLNLLIAQIKDWIALGCIDGFSINSSSSSITNANLLKPKEYL
jgi:hypothetical protein